MSFGDIVAHLIEGNEYLCGTIGGAKAAAHEKLTGASSKDALVAQLKDSFTFCDQALAKVDDSKLERAAPVLWRKDSLAREHHVRDGRRLGRSLQSECDLSSAEREAAPDGEQEGVVALSKLSSRKEGPPAIDAGGPFFVCVANPDTLRF